MKDLGRSGAIILPMPQSLFDDHVDLSKAGVHNSPADAVKWPVTTALTALDITASGVRVQFAKKDGPDRWPDVTPPGWSGPLQYTLWLALQVGGKWHTAGLIEFWHGLDTGGGDITRDDQIAKNWTYDCGPMAYQPAVGEQVGFFVTAGDARKKDVAAHHERSNVVVIPFPASTPASFTFAAPSGQGGDIGTGGAVPDEPVEPLTPSGGLRDAQFNQLMAAMSDIRRTQDEAQAATVDAIAKLRSDALEAVKAIAPLFGGSGLANVLSGILGGEPGKK